MVVTKEEEHLNSLNRAKGWKIVPQGFKFNFPIPGQRAQEILKRSSYNEITIFLPAMEASIILTRGDAEIHQNQEIAVGREL